MTYATEFSALKTAFVQTKMRQPNPEELEQLEQAAEDTSGEFRRNHRKVICKHCGKQIVQDSAGRGWRHGQTGPYRCSDTYAEPAYLLTEPCIVCGGIGNCGC